MFTGEIANSSHMGLSAREMEIIGLVADGLTNQEIAAKILFITTLISIITIPILTFLINVPN